MSTEENELNPLTVRSRELMAKPLKQHLEQLFTCEFLIWGRIKKKTFDLFKPMLVIFSESWIPDWNTSPFSDFLTCYKPFLPYSILHTASLSMECSLSVSPLQPLSSFVSYSPFRSNLKNHILKEGFSDQCPHKPSTRLSIVCSHRNLCFSSFNLIIFLHLLDYLINVFLPHTCFLHESKDHVYFLFLIISPVVPGTWYHIVGACG